MPPQTRKYRLEIAVKRLHGLVNMSSSAKIVFTVRFSDFPEIFIRPQTSGGGGVVERSPAGDRIYSLTYNVCHKAEFRLSDDEYRKMSSSQCVCCVFDEGQRQSQMSWTVACPFTSGQAEGRQHANYPMLDAAGRTMGFAEMLCRVVPVDWAVAPASTATTMTAATGVPPGPVTSGEMPPPMSPAHVSINGKPYVIRVVVNDKAAKKKKNKTHSKPPDDQHDCSVASGALVVVGGGGGSTSSGNKVENKSRGCQLKNTDGNDKRRAMSTAKKKTLLHVLQYDVTCQIQSNCVNLYATLIREFTSLNGAVLNEMTKPMTDKVDSVVQRILKFANIVLHVANDLVEASGNEYTSSPAEDSARKNPVNKLPIPREGSVAHYLMYQVLFQLQCLGTNFCHITTMYRQPLEVRLSTLHHQHAKFIRKLSAEVQELTKCINIIVQSTIDKDCNGKDAFSGPSSASYSTSFTNSSSNSSSSSPLLSSRGSTRRKSSTVESVLSVSTSEDKEVIKPTSALTPSIISTVPQSNAGFQISPAASTQNYSVTSPLPSSMPAQAGQNKPTFSPGYTFPVSPESEKKPLPSAAHFTPPVLDTATVGRPSITSSVFSGLQPLSPAPLSHISVTSGPTAFATEGDTQQQQRQPSLGSGPVPMPVPQATSTASPGASEMAPSMRQPSLGSGPVPMPVPLTPGMPR